MDASTPYTPSRFQLYNRGTNLTFDVFRGNWYWNVTQEKNRVFKQTAPKALVAILQSEIAELMTAPTGTTRTLCFSKWDPESKQRRKLWGLKLSKNEDSTYHIEVSDDNGAYTFPFMSDIGITRGPDLMQEVERSKHGLAAFLIYLKTTLPIDLAMSNAPFDRSGGGNRFSKPQHTGSSSPSSNATPASEEAF